MNTPYFLKVKYLLGLSHSKEIFDWAFQQVEHGMINNDLLEMLSLKENDNNGIVEKLSALANFQNVEKENLLEYFYPLFLKIFEKSLEVVPIEVLLIKFYDLVRDDIEFNDEEKLSFSIIENDLSLRKSELPFQIRENDIKEFLMGRRQLGN